MEVDCVATGARPEPSFKWLIGGEEINVRLSVQPERSIASLTLAVAVLFLTCFFCFAGCLEPRYCNNTTETGHNVHAIRPQFETLGMTEKLKFLVKNYVIIKV